MRGVFPLLGGRDGDILAPLSLTTSLCDTDENISRNIEETLQRPYARFNDYMNSREGLVSICGSAPSLKNHYKSVKGDVFACNAAHDFLIERGIVPTWGMLWDSIEQMACMVEPHREVTYLIASRCHPSVFRKFAQNKVVVWHAGGDLQLDDILSAHSRMEPIVNGGSAAVVRAMFLAWAMGYRQMNLFGVDSSFDEDETHIRKSIVEEPRLDVFVQGKWFKTSPWLAQQAEDFKLIGPALRDSGAEITIYGEGMIPHIAQELGFTVHSLTT